MVGRWGRCGAEVVGEATGKRDICERADGWATRTYQFAWLAPLTNGFEGLARWCAVLCVVQG